ncbi:MAG: NapC/NirT family cytochrome c [Planctomycetes bacterium]|nr:NapC/NirT family cytochrome c [Planctomycetota bacterium]
MKSTKDVRTSTRVVSLGIVSLSSIAVYKLVALAAFVGVPAAAVGIANYHVFEGVKKVQSCYQCHVMRPMVTDMQDSQSMTLAARHYRNKWIAKDQCYACHTDYGLAGTLQAKMDGYRHLARYITGTYTEPIVYRGTYNNQNCLKCHVGTEKFSKVESHATAELRLLESTMSCLNCHGQAHPTRAQRTPEHPDYNGLLEGGGR